MRVAIVDDLEWVVKAMMKVATEAGHTALGVHIGEYPDPEYEDWPDKIQCHTRDLAKAVAVIKEFDPDILFLGEYFGLGPLNTGRSLFLDLEISVEKCVGISDGDTQSYCFHAKSKYLTGSGILADPDPVIQTDLFLPFARIAPALPQCLYGDLWWSKSSSDSFDEGFGNEVDISLGCSGKTGSYRYNVGAAYFLVSRLSRTKGDVAQLYVDVARDFPLAESHTLFPYMRAEVLFPIGWGKGANVGAILFAGVTHTWDIHERITLKHAFAFAYDTGTLVFDRGFLARYDLFTAWKLSKRVSLQLPTLRATTPLSLLNDGREANYTVGGNIVLSLE